MRGTDEQQERMFIYISAEKRVPKDHPLTPENMKPLKRIYHFPIESA